MIMEILNKYKLSKNQFEHLRSLKNNPIELIMYKHKVHRKPIGINLKTLDALNQRGLVDIENDYPTNTRVHKSLYRYKLSKRGEKVCQQLTQEFLNGIS